MAIGFEIFKGLFGTSSTVNQEIGGESYMIIYLGGVEDWQHAMTHDGRWRLFGSAWTKMQCQKSSSQQHISHRLGATNHLT
jgi:hypothetical protein